jgi:NTP pyrophosphatase (non-canonical NTP hydrolase)
VSETVDYENLFERFQEFTKNRFPEAQADSYLTKLNEEFAELQKDPNMEELADCMLVLVGLSRFIPGDLKSAIESKIKKNESRTWAKMPDGTYHHQ